MVRKIYALCFALLLTGAAWSQIVIYPNTTDFESEGLCGTSCSGSCNLIGTWRNADQWGFAQAGTDWLSEDGSTPSTATGPDIDHTLGTATGKYCYVETSGCNNTTAYLVSSIFNFTALTAPKIKFWYHMYGATMGTMHLDVDTTGLGNWALDATPTWTNNNNIWVFKEIDLSAHAGRPSVRLRFRAQTGTSFTSDMAVDDIQVFEPAPKDVNMISVSAGGGCGNSVTTPVIAKFSNGGTLDMLAGASVYLNFMIGSTTVMDTLVLPSTLAAGDTMTYTFVNGYADLSGPSSVTIDAWSSYVGDANFGNDTVSVVTYGIPIITSYPYFENFEIGQNGWIINNGSVGTWAFGTPAKTTINSAASGVNSFVNGGLTGSYSDNDASFVQGPCFDFSNICDPVISLRVWWNAEFSWDGMNVSASTDGGFTWTLVGALGDPLNWYTDNSIDGLPGGFGSGWSGRASTSNGSGGWVTATHRLTGLGNLANVKLRINFGSDGSVTDDGVAFDDIRISNGPWIGSDQTICSPATLSPSADVGGATDTYLWSTAATSSSITVSATGWYSVTTTGPTCATTDSIYVVSVDANTRVDLGVDTSACNSYVLDAGYWPGASILWSTGATTRMVTLTSGGSIMVDVTTPCGVLSDTLMLTISPNPVVNLGADTAACDRYILDAGNGGTTYLWSNSDSTSTITATSSGTYMVTVTNAIGCQGTDDIMLTINASPTVNLGPDQLLCNGANANLDAGNAGSSYAWSNSNTSQTISVNAAGSYSVALTDTNGCSGMDTVAITVGTSPAAAFSFTVGGAGLSYTFTNASTGATSSSWAFGDGNTSTSTSPSHTYAPGSYTATLIVTNACGSDTLTQSLTVTGLASSFANGSVQVYPNPNTGTFRLSFDIGIAEEVVLSVQNLTGQVIFTQNLGIVDGRFERQFTLGGLSAGMYMLRLQSVTGQSVHMMRVDK